MDLPEQKKSDLLHMLGKIACAMAGSLSSPSKAAPKSSLSCCVCESERKAHGPEPALKCHDVQELCEIFAFVLPRLTRASSLRITAMNALRRLLIHVPPESSYLQLKSSVFGDLCLHSLRSSIRELRIVTGYDNHPAFSFPDYLFSFISFAFPFLLSFLL